MNVLFICNDPAIQLTVNSTVDAKLSTFSTFDAATTFLKAHVPDVALIDPETGGGRQGERDTRAFLERFSAADSKFGAVLVLRAPGSEFEVEAVRNPRVWTWDTRAYTDGTMDPEDRLIQALKVASREPEPRHFRAIVRFADDVVTLSVEENGIPVIRNRPLLTDGDAKQNLESLAEENLEPPEFGDFREVWRKYKLRGLIVFTALFGEIGRALISDDPNESVEFRFDIDPMQLRRRFALPLELMTRVANDSHDGFLCNLRPMARRVLHFKRRPANSERPPHILFVNAGTAKGELRILGETEVESRRLHSIQESTDEQRTRLEGFSEAGLCTLEELTLEKFNATCEAHGSPRAASFRDALERRLRRPMDDDKSIDILHFAGHGISRRPTETRLVLLPTPKPNQEAEPLEVKEVDLLEVKELAEWLPGSVRHVFLAACQTASIASAEHLHQAKGCSLVAFRWRVVAKRIPDFVSGFYEAHLRERKSVAVAYHAGCQRARLPEDPASVSAVALAAD